MVDDALILRHIQEDSERFEFLKNELMEIKATLKPIAEVYTTTTTLGKWAMGLLVGLSLVLGIIWAGIQIVLHR